MADKVALEHVSVAAFNFSRSQFIITPILHIQLSIIQKPDHGPDAGRNPYSLISRRENKNKLELPTLIKSPERR
jgi:hypothetical protein